MERLRPSCTVQGQVAPNLTHWYRVRCEGYALSRFHQMHENRFRVASGPLDDVTLIPRWSDGAEMIFPLRPGETRVLVAGRDVVASAYWLEEDEPVVVVD